MLFSWVVAKTRQFGTFAIRARYDNIHQKFASPYLTLGTSTLLKIQQIAHIEPFIQTVSNHISKVAKLTFIFSSVLLTMTKNLNSRLTVRTLQWIVIYRASAHPVNHGAEG